MAALAPAKAPVPGPAVAQASVLCTKSSRQFTSMNLTMTRITTSNAVSINGSGSYLRFSFWRYSCAFFSMRLGYCNDVIRASKSQTELSHFMRHNLTGNSIRDFKLRILKWVSANTYITPTLICAFLTAPYCHILCRRRP